MDVMSAQMDMTILVTPSNVISVKNLNAVNQPNHWKLVDLNTLTAVLVWPEYQEAMTKSAPLVYRTIQFVVKP
jgi:hypothetical protein